ncbi:MAG: undecaprenyl-diphosphate phosphatase [Alphaproteobacteria bacterium]|nr:undecaprenyl-diphosphate phosphatase [Alphaproteobacteria bacterium]
MDTTVLWQASLLGLIEGLTEFIPVSSTGHLLLMGELIGFEGPPGKVFEIVIQLGAILGVCAAYWRRFYDAAIGLFGDKRERRFVRNVLLAFLPAMVLGATLHGFIKGVLFNPWVVAVALVIGGVAIILIERLKPEPVHEEIERFSPKLAFSIGLCQAVAMIPGVSRSGATIMGALLLKVDRKAATEFSFFLAVPTMLAATTYDAWKNRAALSDGDVMIIAIGFAVALVCGLAVVKGLIAWVSRHGFVPFAIYRIVIGSIALAALTWRALSPGNALIPG